MGVGVVGARGMCALIDDFDFVPVAILSLLCGWDFCYFQGSLFEAVGPELEEGCCVSHTDQVTQLPAVLVKVSVHHWMEITLDLL